MTGLVYSLGGQYFCVLTGKPIGDSESEYAKKSGPRRLYQNPRLGVPRFDNIFSIKQKEPHKDRQVNWKMAWPDYVESNG